MFIPISTVENMKKNLFFKPKIRIILFKTDDFNENTDFELKETKGTRRQEYDMLVINRLLSEHIFFSICSLQENSFSLYQLAALSRMGITDILTYNELCHIYNWKKVELYIPSKSVYCSNSLCSTQNIIKGMFNIEIFEYLTVQLECLVAFLGNSDFYGIVSQKNDAASCLIS